MSKRKELNASILAAVVGSGIGDHDQRSALGMAQSWLNNGKPVRWNPDQIEYRKRDQLAKDLVALMEGHERDDCIGALEAARAVVNAPFQDATMATFRAKRDARGPIGVPERKKKAER